MTQSDKIDLAPADKPVPPKSPWLRAANALAVALFCAGLFALCLWLYTQNNTFPYTFHPDEPGKVTQVMYQTRNYLHPQLMLETTTQYMKWRAPTFDPQKIAIAGRQVSAFFGALAAAMLALTAYLCAGWWGLVLGAIVVGLCPPLLTYSHYMKEDTALLVGIAMTVLASRIVWMTHRWWTRIPAWIFLGIACAVAFSGKYAGAMAISFPLLLVFLAPGFRWYRPPLRLLLFLPAFILALGVINHRTLNPAGIDIVHIIHQPNDWRSIFDPAFLHGLEAEAEHSMSQHFGLTAHQPNTYMVRSAFIQTWPYIAIAATLFPLIILLTRRQGWIWEGLAILFTAICTFVLSYSVILFPRYALPIVAMFHLFAAIGLARLLKGLADRPILRRSLGLITTLLLLAALGSRCLDYTWQFGHDSRNTVIEWIAANLPKNARVYGDAYAELDNRLTEARPDLNTNVSFFLPDIISDVDAIARYGGGYVVICQFSYDRYFEPSAIPAADQQSRIERNRRFYKTLLQQHTPIWESSPKHPTDAFTNPIIKIYYIPKAS